AADGIRAFPVTDFRRVLFRSLVFKDTAAGFCDGQLRECAVLVQGGHRGLLDQQVDVILSERAVGIQGLLRVGYECIDRLRNGGRSEERRVGKEGCCPWWP